MVESVVRLQHNFRERIRFFRDEAAKAVVPTVQRAWRCYAARCAREARVRSSTSGSAPRGGGSCARGVARRTGR